MFDWVLNAPLLVFIQFVQKWGFIIAVVNLRVLSHFAWLKLKHGLPNGQSVAQSDISTKVVGLQLYTSRTYEFTYSYIYSYLKKVVIGGEI